MAEAAKVEPQPLQAEPIPGAKIAEPTKSAAIFKPQTLQHDASVNEFRQLQNKFQAYYDQSNVDDKGPALHRAFLLTCMDHILADVINAFIFRDTNVTLYTQILEEYFDNLCPIHVRLHKLTSLNPGSNQSASGFFSEFLRLANEANVSSISNNRVLLTLMTTKYPNKDLRTELLRNPTTVKEAVAKSKQYDAAQKMQELQEVTTAMQKCFCYDRTNHKHEN